MKIKTSILILSLVVFVLVGVIPLDTQEKTEPEEIFVEVLNVEVIVRALKKGTPLGGLKQSDFTLLENGQKREITSFMEIRRKIGITKPKTEDEELLSRLEEKPAEKKRFFLFYFWTFEPGPNYEETLKFFFDNVYREGDTVLMVFGNQVLKVLRKSQYPHVIEKLQASLEQVAVRSKMEHEAMVRRVENLYKDVELQFNQIQVNLRNPRTTSPTEDPGKRRRILEGFIANYKRLWDEFRFKRINMNVDKLKGIATSLKKVEIEKWGLVFFQHDLFAQYDVDSLTLDKIGSFGDNLELKREFANLTRALNKPSEAQDVIKDIRNAFIDANATFHLLLSNPKTPDRTNSRFVKVAPIHSEWQEVFRNICESTGGDIIDGKKLGISLAQVINKEDIYYRLTYAPEVTDVKNRKVEVTTNKKKVKIVYNPNVVLKKPTTVKIENFAFNFPALEFSLKDYQQLYDGNFMYGDIAVKITAVHADGDMAKLERNFEPEDKAITATMKLSFPRGGQYSLIVEARDNQTGKKAVISKKIDVPKTGSDIEVLLTETHKAAEGVGSKNELESVLNKTAQYCEKLKHATFYFTCLEEIEDVYILKGQEVKNDFYRHDYQIIMDGNGRISEKREKMGEEFTYTTKKKRKKKKKDEPPLILTNFYSYYPFLMPVTLLSKENQEKYIYQLLDKEKIGKRDTLKVSVDPRDKGGRDINHGVVWLDVRDGSVVKIELSPYALRGIDSLQKTARRKGAMLKVTDVHWYEIEKEQLRFPSKTEISEVKFAQYGPASEKEREVENSKTVFAYTNYRFFKVNVDVLDTKHK